MGKHQLTECPRCKRPCGVTQLSKAYGCRKCERALTPEEKITLHDALIERNRKVRGITSASRNSLEARQAQIDRMADPERGYSSIGLQRAIQAFQPEKVQAVADFQIAQVDAEHNTQRGKAHPSPSPPRSTTKTMVQLIAEADYAKSIDVVMATHKSKLIQCACCECYWHEKEPPFEETFDMKYLCRHCAYGVLRCGACPLHNNVIYPEIAAKVPRVHPRDYPPAVLAPFDAATFE